MRSYTIKENHIGPLVTEILQYRHPDFTLLFYKDRQRFLNPSETRKPLLLKPTNKMCLKGNCAFY